MASNLFSGKRAVILGCGYVGTAVARELTAHGASVTALTRNPDRARELESVASQVVVANLDAPDWHAAIEPGPDFVLNCVSSAGGGLDGYRRSYIDGMTSVVDWLRERPAGTFVYTSATSVYPQSGGEFVTEDDVPTELTSSGEILREAECVAECASGAWQRAYLLRLGAIYGPNRHHLLDAIRRGDTVFAGEGDFFLNYIHLDDIVTAIFAAFAARPEHPGGVFNVVDGAYPTKREVVEWLAAQLGAPRPSFDPDQDTARGPQRRNAAGQLPNRRVSNQRLRDELGWAPRHTDFRSGHALD